MAGISDFVAAASQKLGVPAGSAQAGVGGLLDLVKTKAGPEVFAQLSKVLPDAAPMASPPAGSGGSVAGVLGGLAEKAGAFLGGAGGQAVGVVGMLQKAGISPDKAAGFASMFVEFLKSKLPPDLVSTILAKVGDLRKVAGA